MPVLVLLAFIILSEPLIFSMLRNLDQLKTMLVPRTAEPMVKSIAMKLWTNQTTFRFLQKVC